MIADTCHRSASLRTPLKGAQAAGTRYTGGYLGQNPSSSEVLAENEKHELTVCPTF